MKKGLKVPIFGSENPKTVVYSLPTIKVRRVMIKSRKPSNRYAFFLNRLRCPNLPAYTYVWFR